MVTNETSPEKRCAWTLYFEQNGVSLTKLINSRSNDRSKSVFSFGFARTQKCKSNQSILLFFWCHMKFKEKEIASIRRIANVSRVISIAYSANIFLSLRMITFQVTRPNRDEYFCELLLMHDGTSMSSFGFTLSQVRCIKDCMEMPLEFKFPSRIAVASFEALPIVLDRLVWPCGDGADVWPVACCHFHK